MPSPARSLSRRWEPNVVGQLEKTEDRTVLLAAVEAFERSRQPSAGASDGHAARPVVPVGGGVHRDVVGCEPDEQLLDQEPIVEHDSFNRLHARQAG